MSEVQARLSQVTNRLGYPNLSDTSPGADDSPLSTLLSLAATFPVAAVALFIITFIGIVAF